MNCIITIFFLCLFSLFAAGQPTLISIQPTAEYALDLSLQRQKDLERRDQLLANGKPTAQEKKELKTLLEKNDETIANIWDVLSMECSWYCGGGNYKIKASSFLTNDKLNRYEAKGANDLSYKTAWVEGKEDEGIGEYLDYYFRNESPRINQVIISNGFVKSDTVWKNNNRVKTLKLSVNGKPYRLLNLKDSRDDQVFEIGTLGRNKNGTDLILRFEIVAIYKGEKYNDTAITEIYFNGIDVH